MHVKAVRCGYVTEGNMILGDILDLSFVQGIVSKAIDSLGMPGFVISILFFLVLVLVLTFRWSHLGQNQRFVLIMTLVLLVFGLGAYVVINTAPAPPRASQIIDEDQIAPGFDVATVNGYTPLEYFDKHLPVPIYDTTTDLTYKNFDYPILALLDTKKRDKTARLRYRVYNTDRFFLALIAVHGKDLFAPIALGVLPKNQKVSDRYLNALGFAFDSKTSFAQAIRVQTESIGKKTFESDHDIVLTGTGLSVTVAGVSAWSGKDPGAMAVFLLDKPISFSCNPTYGRLVFISLDKIKCELPAGRVIAFARRVGGPFMTEPTGIYEMFCLCSPKWHAILRSRSERR